MPKYLSDLEKDILTARMGASVNFSFESSGSVGMMEHSAINPSGNKEALTPY